MYLTHSLQFTAKTDFRVVTSLLGIIRDHGWFNALISRDHEIWDLKTRVIQGPALWLKSVTYSCTTICLPDSS